MTKLGASLSLLDGATLGASLSLRSFARLGASLSVLDDCEIGSSLSLRSFARLGSALSVFGVARFGSSLSVCDGGYQPRILVVAEELCTSRCCCVCLRLL